MIDEDVKRLQRAVPTPGAEDRKNGWGEILNKLGVHLKGKQ